MSTPRRALLAVSAIAVLSGCAIGRTGVTELAHAQAVYYEKLNEELANGRARLKDGLDAQLESNDARRREILGWERDLEKAEILLRVDSNVAGNRRLLSYQLAQLDLQRVDAVSSRDETSVKQAEAIMALYDEMQSAVAELHETNAIITQYLGSGDGAFVIRSIDTDALVAAVAGIEDTREYLELVASWSAQEQTAEREQVRKVADRARETLLKVFELND